MHEFKNECRKLGFETEIVFKGIDKPKLTLVNCTGIYTISNPDTVNELIRDLLKTPDFKGCEIECVGGLINVIVKSK